MMTKVQLNESQIKTIKKEDCKNMFHFVVKNDSIEKYYLKYDYNLSLIIDDDSFVLCEDFQSFLNHLEEWYGLICYNALNRNHYYLLNQLALAAKDDLLKKFSRSEVVMLLINELFKFDDDNQWESNIILQQISESDEDFDKKIQLIMEDISVDNILKSVRDLIPDWIETLK